MIFKAFPNIRVRFCFEKQLNFFAMLIQGVLNFFVIFIQVVLNFFAIFIQGVLRVELKEARDLKSKDVTSASDPYVKLVGELSNNSSSQNDHCNWEKYGKNGWWV